VSPAAAAKIIVLQKIPRIFLASADQPHQRINIITLS